MDIRELMQSDGFGLIKVSATHGGEWATACPWCGGTDRFHVLTDKKERFWCRRCNIKGDAIDYLQRYRKISYREARRIVGKTPISAKPQSPRQRKNSEAIPSGNWSKRAAELMFQAQENLLAITDDVDSLDYDGFKNDTGIHTTPWQFLHGRGLTRETAIRMGLGWMGYSEYNLRKEWGLPITDERHKNLLVPSGLYIPVCNSEGQLIRIRIRNKTVKDGKNYHLLAGSATIPLAFPCRAATNVAHVVMVVESELDALLLHQEAGDLVSVIGLGSAVIRPDKETQQILKDSTIFVSLDTDEAGRQNFYQYWLKEYKNAIHWPVPVGKDPSDAYQQGLNIRVWIEAGIAYADNQSIPECLQSNPIDNVIPFPIQLQQLSEQEQERFAILTIDGNLSDSDALAQINRNNENMQSF